MPLDLSADKPVSNATSDANAITDAFTKIETNVNALPISQLAGYPSDATKFLNGAGSWAVPALVPSGVIAPYAGASAPTGWLICDGSAISRATYAALFTAISTAFGTGDGSTTFNLPDMRGRVPVGVGTHADVSTLGNSDGVAVGSRRPKHKHTVTDPGHTHTSLVTANGSGSGGAGSTAGSTGSSTTGVTVGPQTGSEPTDSAAYLVLNQIIKT